VHPETHLIVIPAQAGIQQAVDFHGLRTAASAGMTLIRVSLVLTFAMTVPMVSPSLFAPLFDHRHQIGAKKTPDAPGWTGKGFRSCTLLVRVPQICASLLPRLLLDGYQAPKLPALIGWHMNCNAVGATSL
jgi:hypothetical protein